MAINTEWTWTGSEEPEGSLCGEKATKKREWWCFISPEEYQEDVEKIAKHILASNVSVVALSEIESEKVASDIADKIKDISRQEWKAIFIKGRDHATGQDVAIMANSDVDVQEVTNFSSSDAPYLKNKEHYKRPSKILGAKLSYGGDSYYVITAHLISKAGANDTKRLKQATAIRKIISKKDSTDTYVLVLGDLNDTPGTPPLKCIKSGKECTAKGLSSVSVLQQTAPKGAYSYTYKGERQLIDHILVEEGLTGSDYQAQNVEFSDHRSVKVVVTPDE